MNALAFGEVLWDVYPTSRHLGGASMNFAAHLKKCGEKVWIATAVGNDLLGKEAKEKILDLGINTEYVTCSENKETGKCLVTLDENKVPSYDLLNDVAYDDIKIPRLGDKTMDVLYFGTLALRNENNICVLKQIISENKFKHLFVDMNIRPPYYSEAVIKFALENATMIKISDEELPIIMNVLGKRTLTAQESSEVLSEEFKNLNMIIITKGEKGSFVYDSKDKKIYATEAKKVQVVSTVGAGDSFSASFLSEYLKTEDVTKALRLATEISGFVVSRQGAIPDYELSDFQ